MERDGADPQVNSVWMALKSKHIQRPRLQWALLGRTHTALGRVQPHELDGWFSTFFSPFFPWQWDSLPKQTLVLTIKGSALAEAQVGTWNPPFPPFLVPHLPPSFSKEPQAPQNTVWKVLSSITFAQSEYPGSHTPACSVFPTGNLDWKEGRTAGQRGFGVRTAGKMGASSLIRVLANTRWGAAWKQAKKVSSKRRSVHWTLGRPCQGHTRQALKIMFLKGPLMLPEKVHSMMLSGKKGSTIWFGSLHEYTKSLRGNTLKC